MSWKHFPFFSAARWLKTTFLLSSPSLKAQTFFLSHLTAVAADSHSSFFPPSSLPLSLYPSSYISSLPFHLHPLLLHSLVQLFCSFKPAPLTLSISFSNIFQSFFKVEMFPLHKLRRGIFPSLPYNDAVQQASDSLQEVLFKNFLLLFLPFSLPLSLSLHHRLHQVINGQLIPSDNNICNYNPLSISVSILSISSKSICSQPKVLYVTTLSLNFFTERMKRNDGKCERNCITG